MQRAKVGNEDRNLETINSDASKSSPSCPGPQTAPGKAGEHSCLTKSEHPRLYFPTKAFN